MKGKAVREFLRKYKVPITWALRILIGGLFVVSGVAKAIDVWGFVYKIEEYFNVWNIAVPHSLMLTAAIALSGAEFLGGLALLTGCYRRISVWLLSVVMAGMLPITLYIYIANPVSDCGCFGDFMIISNALTFWKNITISLCLVYLLIYNHKVKGLYHPYFQWAVVMAGFIYILFVSLYGYMVQPMIDFRSFPIGTDLGPNECVEDIDYDNAVEFIYEKDGQRAHFTIDSLPDSTWVFVDRVSEASIDVDTQANDLTIYDNDDNDITSDVISTEGLQLIITLPDYHRANLSYTYLINELQKYVEEAGGDLIEIADLPVDKVDAWIDYSMADYPVYRTESTIIKELARGTMAVVYLRNGKIVGKRNLGAIDLTLMEQCRKDGGEPLSLLSGSDVALFWEASGSLLISLILILAMQIAVKAIRKHRKSCRQSK